MNLVKKITARLRTSSYTMLKIDQKLDELAINQGAILANLNRQRTSSQLCDYEFKVFSQWGEDGIIQRLVDVVEIKNKTFIEFGVHNFLESNCRFLLMQNNWSGFVIDGCRKNINTIKSSYFFWKHHLIPKCAFVTRENVNMLLAESDFHEDLGILSIDIDGVDYYILDAITSFRPRILIVEFNSIFGSHRKISVPYRPDFNRTKAHYSNLYFGASLPALAYLAEKKGYFLVGTNSSGVNAFFIREDLMNSRLQRLSPVEAFNSSNFRESLDEFGELTYLSGDARYNAIKGLPVVNVETGCTEIL